MMTRNPEPPPPKQIVQRSGPIPNLPQVPEFLRRIYGARGVQTAADLDRSLSGLEPPSNLRHIDVAAERIATAVRSQQRILLVGDYDADGATSVALGVSALQAFGAQQVDFLVPNRFSFGYGLSPEITALALAKSPDLIITVDNGISSLEGVERANEQGVDVIVTDHHLPGKKLPPAYAIVNPNAPGCSFPSKALAGVGVIYYVLAQVRSRLRAAQWFNQESLPEPVLANWLDLVALGTVADVVPLDQNNRRLVHQGLVRIRRNQCRPGVAALAKVGRRELARLQAADLGFALAPRLNAAGRLDDMTIGVQCLLAPSLDEAMAHAKRLDALNQERRDIEQSMLADAELLVLGHAQDIGDRFGVVVFDPSWHQGVVGLIAGRLRERWHRPVIAFAEAGLRNGATELKGSARSLPGLHIRDTLDHIAAQDPALLSRFGGHAMAAGMSINRNGLERFSKAFDDEVRQRLSAQALQSALETDGELQGHDLTLDNALLLANAGPWGQGFPEPLFHGDFELISQRVVGGAHLKLTLRLDDRLVGAIAFQQPPIADCQRVRLAYALDVNDYNGVSLQLRVQQTEAIG